MPTREKNPRDEFDHHEMESRSSFDQHKNQKGGNKMKRKIEMSRTFNLEAASEQKWNFANFSLPLASISKMSLPHLHR